MADFRGEVHQPKDYEHTDHPTEIANKLRDVQERTEGDWIYGEVVKVFADNYQSELGLRVVVPPGLTLQFAFHMPIPFSRDFQIVRIMEDLGIDGDNFEKMLGQKVKVKQVDETNSNDQSSWSEVPVFEGFHTGSETDREDYVYRSEAMSAEDVYSDGREWEMYDPLTHKETLEEKQAMDIALAFTASAFVLAPILMILGGAILWSSDGLILGILSVATSLAFLFVNQILVR